MRGIACAASRLQRIARALCAISFMASVRHCPTRGSFATDEIPLCRLLAVWTT
jgi:hypothetical protein